MSGLTKVCFPTLMTLLLGSLLPLISSSLSPRASEFLNCKVPVKNAHEWHLDRKGMYSIQECVSWDFLRGLMQYKIGIHYVAYLYAHKFFAGNHCNHINWAPLKPPPSFELDLYWERPWNFVNCECMNCEFRNLYAYSLFCWKPL